MKVLSFLLLSIGNLLLFNFLTVVVKLFHICAKVF